ncbi:MAG: EamA family transporter [Actinobacteria bacterium]|nr:EamA family transporter [Actinomycetota bacterium]
MAIVLALGAAAFYGSSDFMGAVATRRSAALAVAFLAQVAGLAVLVAVLPLLGPASVRTTDLLAGALAGVFGGVGVVLVYQVLSRGPMSVVAPTTALAASAVPILAGLLAGERPGPSAAVGIVIAFVAVTLISREQEEEPAPLRASLGRVLPAVGAGSVLGLFFVCLHLSGDDAGLWPLLAARVTSVPVLAALLVARRTTVPRSRSLVAPVLVSGVLDMTANVLFLMASRQGMLAVVATLTGLYPAATIVLARTRLGERMQPVQFAGLGAAVVAAAMVAA